MLFSVWPAPKRPTDEVLDLARQADQLGYFGFWFADHYMPDSGNEAAETGPVRNRFGLGRSSPQHRCTIQRCSRTVRSPSIMFRTDEWF